MFSQRSLERLGQYFNLEKNALWLCDIVPNIIAFTQRNLNNWKLFCPFYLPLIITDNNCMWEQSLISDSLKHQWDMSDFGDFLQQGYLGTGGEPDVPVSVSTQLSHNSLSYMCVCVHVHTHIYNHVFLILNC